MASPITVGTTAVIVVPVNKHRSSIRFQNVGTTTINIKKVSLHRTIVPVSISDFEVQLFGASTSLEGGEAFVTDSILGFMAISSSANGSLAVYETNII